MPCVRLGTAFVCGPAGPYKYTYKGREWLFEVHSYCGPWPLRKKDEMPWGDGVCKLPKVFWEMYEVWNNLPIKEKQMTSIYYKDRE